MVPEKIDGEGHVDFHVPRLMLLPGTYDVTASIWDYTITRPFDGVDKILRFDVDHGAPTEHHGFMSLGGEWNIVERERTS
jgi:ABC-2 type transport system ATP-binding protein